jgi:hypothetical protein
MQCKITVVSSHAYSVMSSVMKNLCVNLHQASAECSSFNTVDKYVSLQSWHAIKKLYVYNFMFVVSPSQEISFESLKGLSHEINFKNLNKNIQNLA